MDALSDRTDRAVNFEVDARCISYVWAHTTERSGLRRFILDLFTVCVQRLEEWLRKFKEHIPVEFFFDLAMRQIQQRNSDIRNHSPSYKERWRYHDHASEEESLNCEVACREADLDTRE